MTEASRRLLLTTFTVYGIFLAGAAGIAVYLEFCKDDPGRQSSDDARVVESLERGQLLVLSTGVGLAVIPAVVVVAAVRSEPGNSRRWYWTRRRIERGYRHVSRVLDYSRGTLLLMAFCSVLIIMLGVIAIPTLQWAVQKRMLTIPYDRTVANGLERAVGEIVVWVGALVHVVLLAVAIKALARRHRLSKRRGVCRQCGYNLKGCHSERCPECGTPRAGFALRT